MLLENYPKRDPRLTEVQRQVRLFVDQLEKAFPLATAAVNAQPVAATDDHGRELVLKSAPSTKLRGPHEYRLLAKLYSGENVRIDLYENRENKKLVVKTPFAVEAPHVPRPHQIAAETGRLLDHESRMHLRAQGDLPAEKNWVVACEGLVKGPLGIGMALEYLPLGDAALAARCWDITGRKRGGDEGVYAAQHMRALAFTDMVKGVMQAHANGVIHLDIKPQNFMLDASGRAKLGDFGTASDERFTVNAPPVDLLDYAAPETARINVQGQPSVGDKVITYQADVWSLGVILNGLMAGGGRSGWGSSPFSDSGALIKFSNVDEATRRGMLGHRNPEHGLFDDLVLRMLNPSPTLRPSLQEVLAHPDLEPLANPKTEADRELVREARKLMLESVGEESAAVAAAPPALDSDSRSLV